MSPVAAHGLREPTASVVVPQRLDVHAANANDLGVRVELTDSPNSLYCPPFVREPARRRAPRSAARDRDPRRSLSFRSRVKEKGQHAAFRAARCSTLRSRPRSAEPQVQGRGVDAFEANGVFGKQCVELRHAGGRSVVGKVQAEGAANGSMWAHQLEVPHGKPVPSCQMQAHGSHVGRAGDHPGRAKQDLGRSRGTARCDAQALGHPMTCTERESKQRGERPHAYVRGNALRRSRSKTNARNSRSGSLRSSCNSSDSNARLRIGMTSRCTGVSGGWGAHESRPPRPIKVERILLSLMRVERRTGKGQPRAGKAGWLRVRATTFLLLRPQTIGPARRSGRCSNDSRKALRVSLPQGDPLVASGAVLSSRRVIEIRSAWTDEVIGTKRSRAGYSRWFEASTRRGTLTLRK